MCYSVYLSTDSPEDLSRRNSTLVRFEKLDSSLADPCTILLDHPNRWYVGSKSECGCTFRHLMSTELGFSEPEDWLEEEQDSVDATRELFSTLSFLLSTGHQVDLIDRWQGAQPEDIIIRKVLLEEVSAVTFRLFENHKFIFEEKNHC